MASSINSKLVSLSQEYYIEHGSDEQRKIDASVSTLKQRLKTYFDNKISEIIEFGSYKRDTILPREYDKYSDVDLMIVFNHSTLGVQPRTYRDYLIKFAEKYYSKSDVKKSSPTVTLQLGHINYDLIPAHKVTYEYLKPTLYIPQSDTQWMTTDPNGFNAKLTDVNKAYGFNIKKTIRLLKAWNAMVDYPIQSYELEKEIAGITFWFCNNLEDYFFNSIENLNSYRKGSYVTKVAALKENAKKVKSHLQSDNEIIANVWLAHILPL